MRTLVACVLMLSLSLACGCRPRFRGAVKPATAKPAAKPMALRNAPAKPKAAKKSAKADPALTQGLEALDKEDYDRAIDLFTQVIERDGKNAQAFYFRACAYVQKGEEEDALFDVNKAIEFDQTIDGAYTLRGWLRCQNDEFD